MTSLLLKIKHKISDPISFTILLLSVCYSLVVIVTNFSDSLWYDEAWRAALISDGHLDLAYSHAPLSIGDYLIGRFIDLFSQTNFSQRITDYIALLALPFVVFAFCKVYFNKSFARVMVVLTFLSGYVIENSSIDKPYLLDIVFTLLLILAYKLFINGKLRPVYFAILTIVADLVSFSAFFVLPCIGALLIYRYLKTKKPEFKFLVILLTSWIVVSGLQLSLFISPQLRKLLHAHWSSLFLTGSVYQIIVNIFDNLANIFGFEIGSVTHSPTLEMSNIFWGAPQFRLFGKPVVGTQDILATLFVIIFIYGIYKLIKKRSEIPIFLLGILLIQVITALAQKWPFGDARSNIFSLFLMYIILVYGAYSLIIDGIHKSEPIKIATATLAVILCTLFPYKQIVYLLDKQYNLSQPGAGMQQNAVYVAKHSSKNDYIAVSNVVGPLGFQYYYKYSSYTKQYRYRDADNIIYAYSPFDPLILPNLKTNSPKTIWVIIQSDYPGRKIKAELSEIGQRYSLKSYYNNGDVVSEQYVLNT